MGENPTVANKIITVKVVTANLNHLKAFELVFFYINYGRNRTLYVYYDWDNDKNNWVGEYKYENAYDTNSNETLYNFLQLD